MNAAGTIVGIVVNGDHDDALRINVGKWLQQHVVDHTKNGRGRADA